MANTLSIVKGALRIPTTVTLYDAELSGLIEAATVIMGDAGIDLERESPEVLDSACVMYVKSTFGARSDAERCRAAFEAIVRQRALVKWGDD